MNYHVTAVHHIDPKRVQDMFVGAFEGGSNHWLGRGRVGLVEPSYDSLPAERVVWYGRQHNVFARPFKITIEHEDETITIDNAKVAEALNEMANEFPTHFNDLVTETDDAGTADCFLQLVCFGELVYG